MSEPMILAAIGKNGDIRFAAPVTIKAAASDAEKKGPPAFDVLAYTGGMMKIEGRPLPVVIDLAGLKPGNNIVANLDHDRTQRVGNVKDVVNDGKTLLLAGVASAVTPSRAEVVDSAAEGFTWEASIEVAPGEKSDVAQGAKQIINGQSFTGPFTWVRASTLKGFAFVSHGADDNTTVTIAAIAPTRTNSMDPALFAFISTFGFDPATLSPEQVLKFYSHFRGPNR